MATILFVTGEVRSRDFLFRIPATSVAETGVCIQKMRRQAAMDNNERRIKVFLFDQASERTRAMQGVRNNAIGSTIMLRCDRTSGERQKRVPVKESGTFPSLASIIIEQTCY